MEDDFKKDLLSVLQKDDRYDAEAYHFVMKSLNRCQEKKNKPGHVSSPDLLEKIAKLGIEQYGPMTKSIFNHWGIECTQDFGHIVYNLIEVGILRKSKSDHLDDFANVYDFEDVFEKNYDYSS